MNPSSPPEPHQATRTVRGDFEGPTDLAEINHRSYVGVDWICHMYYLSFIDV